jgi:predicted phosphodiesterase
VRVAALYDIHGNLPALEAVLADVARAQAEVVVIGGDVAAGPQPRETIERLAALAGVHDVRYVRGNADREVVDAFDQGRDRPDAEDDPAQRTAAFAAASITRDHRDFLAGFLPTVTLEIDGLGAARFCHGSPRNDTEIITTRTSDQRLSQILTGVAEPVVIGGHTHRQLDRRAGGHRFVNAGSVGAPYEGRAGAYWALLGPDVVLRRTGYDLDEAVRVLRGTGSPDVEEFIGDSLTRPVDPDETSAFFEGLAGQAAAASGSVW